MIDTDGKLLSPTASAEMYVANPDKLCGRVEMRYIVQGLLEENKALREALNEISAWNEGTVVTSSFDEPHSARIAREALREA